MREEMMNAASEAAEVAAKLIKAIRIINDDLQLFYEHRLPEDKNEAGKLLLYGLPGSEERISIALDYICDARQQAESVEQSIMDSLKAAQSA